MQSEANEEVNPGEKTYKQFGFKLFDTVSAVPFLVPNTEGDQCLLGVKLEIANSDNGETLFNALIPAEVSLALIANMATVHAGHLEIIAKGSYKIDSQLVTREGVKQSMLALAQSAQKLVELIDIVFVDDSVQELATEQTSS